MVITNSDQATIVQPMETIVLDNLNDCATDVTPSLLRTINLVSNLPDALFALRDCLSLAESQLFSPDCFYRLQNKLGQSFFIRRFAAVRAFLCHRSVYSQHQAS